MAVTRTNRAAATRTNRAPRAEKAPRRKAKLKAERPAPPQIMLPTKRHVPSTRIEDYSILLYGPPKIAKTTFFCFFPDPIYLMTEPGKPGYPVFIFNEENGGVTDWTLMRRAVDLLESTDRFANVLIDTLDEGYDQCLRHVSRLAGYEHPHDANDYGKTWGAVTREFTDMFRRLKNTGRGVYMTSHANEELVTTASGREYTKIGPNLTGKSGKKILALADFIFFVDYYNVDDRDVRVVVTEGGELVTAGQRKIGNLPGLPKYIALPEDETKDYEVFAAAFRGEVKGLDPEAVRPSAATSAAGREAATKDRMDAVKRRGGARR